MANDYPRLRQLQLVPTEYQGRKMILFQDPEQVTQEAVMMPVEILPIIQFFDGQHTFRDIQEEIMRKTGQLLDSQIIAEIAQELDEHLLLDSEHFQQFLTAARESWDALTVRPAVHAGSGYPAEAPELQTLLDGFYTAPEGPGPIDPARRGNGVRGVLAPHIEVKSNGPCYAHAFKALAEQTNADLFLIFGTGHHLAFPPFVLCEKDFETPLGVVKTDRAFIAAVRRELCNQSEPDDQEHAAEHSVEFQTLFLQHALGGKREFTIAPILVGSFSLFVQTRESPADDPSYGDYVAAFRRALAGRKAAFIVGGDLAHLGPRYGDEETYRRNREDEIRAADLAMLKTVEQGGPAPLLQCISADEDRRHICGLPPLYAALDVFRPAAGELLSWSCWYDDASGSAVSFAAMAFR